MKKKLVWIIDDDPIFKIIAQKIIQKAEKLETLDTFSNGEEAFKAFQTVMHENESLPNLILLDIEMPVMDGWEFVNHISSFETLLKEKDIKIFILSSSIAIEDKLKAESSSTISGYLTKPLSLTDLERIVQ